MLTSPRHAKAALLGRRKGSGTTLMLICHLRAKESQLLMSKRKQILTFHLLEAVLEHSVMTPTPTYHRTGKVVLLRRDDSATIRMLICLHRVRAVPHRSRKEQGTIQMLICHRPVEVVTCGMTQMLTYRLQEGARKMRVRTR